MTYDEFVLEAIAEDLGVDRNYGKKYDNGRSYAYSRNSKLTKEGDFAVSVNWRTGGQSGGSCWDEGESNHYAVDGDTEPDFDDFEKLVLHFAPEISFVGYRDLRKEVIKQKTWSENEYYGNYSNYTEKYAYLKDIYAFLTGHGYINA